MVGYVGEEWGLALARFLGSSAWGVPTSAGVTEALDPPPDVMTSVLHWVRKGCAAGPCALNPSGNPLDVLVTFRLGAIFGAAYCYNDGCEVMGHLKEFKVCPQCKTARYCGAACQNQDWTTGRHQEMCGKFSPDVKSSKVSAPSQ